MKHSTEVKISSPDATQFVRWPMDKDRTVETFWNHAAGLTAVASAGTSRACLTCRLFSRVVCLLLFCRSCTENDRHLLCLPLRFMCTAVNVTYKTNADGQGKQSCYTNPYGIMPLSAHGGSYPGAFFNTAGNTVTGECVLQCRMNHASHQALTRLVSLRNDSDRALLLPASHCRLVLLPSTSYCMSIAVMLTTSSTSGNGWYQNGNGGDAPVGDEDWPNLSYVVDGQTEDQEALIWLR